MKLYRPHTPSGTRPPQIVISSHYLDRHLDRFTIWLVEHFMKYKVAGLLLYASFGIGFSIFLSLSDRSAPSLIEILALYLMSFVGIMLLPCAFNRYERLYDQDPPTPRPTNTSADNNLQPLAPSLWITLVILLILLIGIDLIFDVSATVARSDRGQRTVSVHSISLVLFYSTMGIVSVLFGSLLGSHLTTSRWIRRLLHADSPITAVAVGFSILRDLAFLSPLTGLFFLWFTWPTQFQWLPMVFFPTLLIWCFYWWSGKETPSQEMILDHSPAPHIRTFQGGGKSKRQGVCTRTITHDTAYSPPHTPIP